MAGFSKKIYFYSKANIKKDDQLSAFAIEKQSKCTEHTDQCDEHKKQDERAERGLQKQCYVSLERNVMAILRRLLTKIYP